MAALDRAQLMKMAPGLAYEAAGMFTQALNAAMNRYNISTPLQQAHFLAQVLHESDDLIRFVENLNYSVAALQSNWPARFTAALAAQYGRSPNHPANPQMIANIAYGSRMGNGPIASGDGWKYRGRGAIQLTGRDMYKRCGEAMGLDLLTFPEQLERPAAACMSAAWFWAVGNSSGKSLNALADAGATNSVSKAVNGGTNGLAERLSLTVDCCKVLGVGNERRLA